MLCAVHFLAESLMRMLMLLSGLYSKYILLALCREPHCLRCDQLCHCCDPNPFCVLMKSPFGRWAVLPPPLMRACEMRVCTGGFRITLMSDERDHGGAADESFIQPLAAACWEISTEIQTEIPPQIGWTVIELVLKSVGCEVNLCH